MTEDIINIFETAFVATLWVGSVLVGMAVAFIVVQAYKHRKRKKQPPPKTKVITFFKSDQQQGRGEVTKVEGFRAIIK